MAKKVSAKDSLETIYNKVNQRRERLFKLRTNYSERTKVHAVLTGQITVLSQVLGEISFVMEYYGRK